MRATDLELTLEQSFPAEISEHGAVTVPAKLFSGYLGNLPAGLLELTGSPTRASIKAERSNYDFLALPPDEYPPLPSAQKGVSFAIAAKKFRDGVNSTIFAASSEEARGAVLMGTLLELEGSSITLVATDGYRLAKWTGTLDRPFEGSAKYIVPSRALAEAARNLGSAEMLEATALGAQANQLMLTAGTTSIVVRLVDGQYPNYGQVIPAKFDRSVTVNTSGLIGGLRRAELVAGDRASMVKLEVANNTLMITAKSDVTGNAYEELEVEQTGDDLTIAFNARYLVEILNHVDSPQTVLEFLGPAFARGDPSARSERSRHAALRVDAAAPVATALAPHRAAAGRFSQLRDAGLYAGAGPERFRRAERARQEQLARGDRDARHRQIVSRAARESN